MTIADGKRCLLKNLDILKAILKTKQACLKKIVPFPITELRADIHTIYSWYTI